MKTKMVVRISVFISYGRVLGAHTKPMHRMPIAEIGYGSKATKRC